MGGNHNHHRHFTVEQANAMLPLVRAVAKDLSDLSRDVIERRERLAHLLAGRNKQSTGHAFAHWSHAIQVVRS